MQTDPLAIVVAVVIAALPGAAFAVLIWSAFKGPRFTFGRNPFRRTCTRCGQQQDGYCYEGEWHNGWWEPMGDIMDPDCSCHEAVPERYRPKVWMDAAELARTRQRRDVRAAEVPG